MSEILNHGFIDDVITPDNYSSGDILGGGSLEQKVLQPNGNWLEFLPKLEVQNRNGLETYGCTGYGTLNAIEILAKKVFGLNWDKSERLVGVKAGTKPPGNSPHKVCETIRKIPCIADEDILPFDDKITELAQYYSLENKEALLERLGELWLEQFSFGHEWVFTKDTLFKEKHELIKENLRYSPICVSVRAWRKEGDFYVKEKGEQDTHWGVIANATPDEYIFFDSYDNQLKRLHPDYDFGVGKRFSLDKKTQVSFWQFINSFLKKWQRVARN